MDELQIKQIIKTTVEEAVIEKQDKQSQLIAESIVKYLKENNNFDDVDHKLQHEWIKQQIEKEKKLQDKYSDFKWKSAGSIFFFGFVTFISVAGWAVVKFIEEIIKNGGS